MGVEEDEVGFEGSEEEGLFSSDLGALDPSMASRRARIWGSPSASTLYQAPDGYYLLHLLLVGRIAARPARLRLLLLLLLLVRIHDGGSPRAAAAVVVREEKKKKVVVEGSRWTGCEVTVPGSKSARPRGYRGCLVVVGGVDAGR